MKRVLGFLLFATSLLYNTMLLAQVTVNKDDMIIHISITSPSVSLGNDHIDIHKQGAKAEITYKKFNTIAFDDVRVDTAYINLGDIRLIDFKKTKKLGEIFDRHTIYDTTKVIVNLQTDTAYHKTLQLLAQSSKQELETSKIGELIILDGFYLSCEIITATDVKNIYIRTPTPDTHPIVAALLEESYNKLFKKTRSK